MDDDPEYGLDEKPVRHLASFSLAAALSAVRRRQDEQKAADKDKEKALEDERKEKARAKKKRRRQNQKLTKAQAKASEPKAEVEPIPEPKNPQKVKKRKRSKRKNKDRETQNEVRTELGSSNDCNQSGDNEAFDKSASLRFLPRTLMMKKGRNKEEKRSIEDST